MDESTLKSDRQDCSDEALDSELEAQIDRAMQEAHDQVLGPSITHAAYEPSVDALSIRINTGQRLLIPTEDMQGLDHAAHEQLANVEIVGKGDGIGFSALDIYFSVEGMLAGRYGSKRWMDQLEAKRSRRFQPTLPADAART